MTQKITKKNENKTIIEIQCSTSSGPFIALLHIEARCVLCMPIDSTSNLNAQETERRALLIAEIAKFGYGETIVYDPIPNAPRWVYLECAFTPKLAILRIDGLTDNWQAYSAEFVSVDPNPVLAAFRPYYEGGQ